MKQLPLYLILFCSQLTSEAQDPDPVSRFQVIDQSGTAEEKAAANEQYRQSMLSRDPQWDEKRAAYELALQQFIASKKASDHTQSQITIPVVVHIVYNTAIENIPDSQVYSQLQVLNEDYIRQNADTVNTPAPFALVAANPGIQFCLAQRDPNGQPTTGIERRQTTMNTFTMYDVVQTYSGGGMDQWDPTRYFNIWVCNSLYYGKGEFPLPNTTATYGAVVSYTRFGSNHTVYGTFPALNTADDYGRIATHEIGHCLNLYHVNGDDGTACTGTDYCADTPDQAGYTNYTCPVFPQYDACTPSGNGIMFENYMDYSLGSCQNLFTKDQSIRMNAVLSIPPYNALAVSDACQSPTAVTDYSEPPLVIFPNPFTASFTLQLPHPIPHGRFVLFDLLGHVVMEKVLDSAATTLQRGDLPGGLYLYEVLGDGGLAFSGKLIAQ